MQKRKVYSKIPLFWHEDMDWQGERCRSAKRAARRWRRIQDEEICRRELNATITGREETAYPKEARQAL